MDHSLEYYKVFYHVAKCGSVTQAAEGLHISQPAVSQAIKHLESALGGKLFNRTTKGVRLTSEGEVLFSHVSKGYEAILLGQAKFKDLLDLEAGEVRIGASDMTLRFFLLPYIERFHSLYPKVRVKVSNAPTPETIASLDDGRIDFGVVSAPIMDSGGLHVTPVGRIRDVFVAGSRFAGLKDRVVPLPELEELPIITLERITSTRRYVDGFLAENGVELNPEFDLATSDLIVKFAEMNLGVGCVVRDFAMNALDSGTLFEISLDKPIPGRDLCVVVSDRASISPAGKRLLDMLI